MNDCRQVHETVVRDIIDVIGGVRNFADIDWLTTTSTGSIAKRASNLVMVFPVITSTQISMESAMLISKAIEAKCVSLLQILFSSVQISTIGDLQGYISQFHKNLNLRGGLIDYDDFFAVTAAMVDEGVIKITDKDVYEAVMEDMKNLNFYLTTEYNEKSLNDYSVRRNLYGESGVVYAPEKKKKENPYTYFKEALGDELGDSTRFYEKQITSQEIEKLNALQPTTMMVNFTYYDPESGVVVDSNQTGVVGVKAKLYPVDSNDIINRISSKYVDKNGLFNLVRASTREISFFKDLAFAVSKAKVDAFYVAKDSNNAKMFKVLERRAAQNKFLKLLKRNDASAITSLVITMDEVNYLRKYHNIDMEKSFVSKKILEAYNLMDIIIVDESLEVAKFLYDDGDGVFENMDFDSLHRENKDGSYKKIINLVNKMNR